MSGYCDSGVVMWRGVFEVLYHMVVLEKTRIAKGLSKRVGCLQVLYFDYYLT